MTHFWGRSNPGPEKLVEVRLLGRTTCAPKQNRRVPRSSRFYPVARKTAPLGSYGHFQLLAIDCQFPYLRLAPISTLGSWGTLITQRSTRSKGIDAIRLWRYTPAVSQTLLRFPFLSLFEKCFGQKIDKKGNANAVARTGARGGAVTLLVCRVLI